jgi:hypothetical protein
MKEGDFVKLNNGGRIGVITEIMPCDGYNLYLIAYHNGMKIRTMYAKEERVKTLLTKRQFLDYIKKSGNTSMYQYINN